MKYYYYKTMNINDYHNHNIYHYNLIIICKYHSSKYLYIIDLNIEYPLVCKLTSI